MDIKNAPIHFISAKTGSKVNLIMDEVIKTYDKWNSRAESARMDINRYLEAQGTRAERFYIAQMRKYNHEEHRWVNKGTFNIYLLIPHIYSL